MNILDHRVKRFHKYILSFEEAERVRQRLLTDGDGNSGVARMCSQVGHQVKIPGRTCTIYYCSDSAK
jgi:hypothetical protein